jgi:hypothetical protein
MKVLNEEAEEAYYSHDMSQIAIATQQRSYRWLRKTDRRQIRAAVETMGVWQGGKGARGQGGALKYRLGPPGRYALPFYALQAGGCPPETALWPFQGWPALKVDGLRQSSTPSDTPRPTPMVETDERK